MELWKMSATELAALLDTRQVTATEVCASFFARIDETEPKLDAFLHKTREAAHRRAAEADRRLAAGEARRPLEGLPIGLKDNICTRDIPTTCASRILEGFLPPYSATVAEKLDAAGAILLGKLNMTEFAAGLGDRFKYGEPRNPWDLTRTAAGSSTAVDVRVSPSIRTKSQRMSSRSSSAITRSPVRPPTKPVAMTGCPSRLITRATLTPLPPGRVTVLLAL